ncbi:imidazolonepropionase [Flavobacteriaceae bacterium F89]|uniref:Imidazolonepropionase n=1 Tax=Cerina litoralis TaxID=2874477 RepID=A0AAE3ES93_9FLAO|nr:imidazolonepropionase [Cerina litoralis]MCG2460287.1 imidazolonepropionase [Cerina litoralis]
MKKAKLIGPFTQLLPMTGLSLKGAIADSELSVLEDSGILVEDRKIRSIGKFDILRNLHPKAEIFLLKGHNVGIPGFIDAHTHICFGGSRANDYAMRNAGKSYLEIAKAGGGIWDTVTQTRQATQEELVDGILERARWHLENGTTTIEVKSGYGLSLSEEIKMLRAIKEANLRSAADLVSTCLAAHILPKDFRGTAEAYLKAMGDQLFPILTKENLAHRIDAFIEESAFSSEQISPYLQKAKAMGFSITVHADQFTTGGSEVAVQFGAISADHLEVSGEEEIRLLAQSDTIATALPGATLGLGCSFAPARRILDAGGVLVIASDHNPGSAPMGNLLVQATLIGVFEKLSNAEVLAGITFRAAAALGLSDRGQLAEGFLADFLVFPTGHYNEILYHQGSLGPSRVWKKGELVCDKNK